MDFEIVGRIGGIETIASGTGIRERARLRRIYGQGRWRKCKAVGDVRLRDGDPRTAEIHSADPKFLGLPRRR
jgi:hypothetical protein